MAGAGSSLASSPGTQSRSILPDSPVSVRRGSIGTPGMRSSASLSSLPPSPVYNNLSFAGSLAGSLMYERQNHRLAPVDGEHLAFMTSRKLKANAAALHTVVERQELGEQTARQEADRLGVEASALQNEVAKSQSSVLAARSTLLSTQHYRPSTVTDTMLTRQQRQEAMRETARDCVRREAAQRRAEAAHSASKLAERQAQQVAQTEVWERHEVALRERLHEAALARKMGYEDLRKSRALSHGDEREAEKRATEARKRAEEERQKESSAVRAKEREARKVAKKEKAESMEVAREHADAKRRTFRAELQANLAANRAEKAAQQKEAVWIQAQAVERKLKAELERKRQEVIGRALELDEQRKCLASELEGLQRKLEIAQGRCLKAKENYEESATAAREAIGARKLWLSDAL